MQPSASARRAARGRQSLLGSTPRSTCVALAEGAPTSPLFHEFAPPPSGGGHQFLRALVRELEGRGLAVEPNRISGGTPACLFNSFNFDFRRLRRFARTGRADGAPGRRPDRRVPGLRRRHRRADRGDQRRARRRDDPPVPLLAREAPRARVRAARPGRDPERGRPGDLPSARGARAARGQAGPARRDQLVGQPAEGRRRARLARPQPRPRALRGHVRRPAARGVRAHPRRRPARLARRSPT